MIFEIPKVEILGMVKKQLSCYFPLDKFEVQALERAFPLALEKCEHNFSRNSNRYFHSQENQDEAYFNPFHSGQWTIFLYQLSHLLHTKCGGGKLKDKVFYLNKIMNGIDIFYDVSLPDFFTLNHQVGTVLGRANYSDGFSFIQNCTVGENFGKWPTIGKDVCMCAGSSIIGDSVIGDNVLIGANATIKDEVVPSNVVVFGESPNLVIKRKKNLQPFYW